ncbi:MAG: diacylglycerol kinase family protein [Actinomycetota bacterium]
MPTALLMANPSASQFTGGIYRQVVSSLKKRFDLTTSWPVSALETGHETRVGAEGGVDVVFAMGGDGVAHHVANGLVGTDTALGLIPAGTTNVLARILGVPNKPVAAAAAAADYQALPTRMVRVVADTDYGEITRYATFSLGVGFDADVVKVAETRPFAKSRFGSVHYASTAIMRLLSSWRSEVPTLRVECDGDRFDAVVALTQVHDPYTYFGAVPLHLTPDPPEGVATFAANDLGVRRATEIFTRAVLGRKHRDATGVKLWTDYQSLIIDADPKTQFQADGELLGTASRLEIAPVEGAMKVLRPGNEMHKS